MHELLLLDRRTWNFLAKSSQGDNMCNLFGVNSLLSGPAAYMLLAAVFMIPTVWLPDLSALSTLGFLGVTASCTVTATVRMERS